MLPTGVVGVTAVGIDGRVVRSAKASVPFRARLTGQGVESGVTNPLTVSCHVEVSGVQPGAVTLSTTLKIPGLVGMPEMVPVLGSGKINRGAESLQRWCPDGLY